MFHGFHFFNCFSVKHFSCKIKYVLNMVQVRSTRRYFKYNPTKFFNSFSSIFFSFFFLNFVVDILPSRIASQPSHCSKQMLLGNHCEQYQQILISPSHCSHRATPELYAMPTIKLVLTDYSFLLLGVHPGCGTSCFFLQVLDFGARAWSRGLVLI